MEIVKNFISGEFSMGRSNDRIDLYEPATGKIYGYLNDSNIEDVNSAIAAAKAVFPLWSKLTVKDRSEFLINISKEMSLRLNTFSKYETRDTGKPISLSNNLDIPRAIENFQFFADYIRKYNFTEHLNNNKSKNKIQRSPLGVVCCISPWNLPLYLFTWKIAPALASGNTVVAKPSEIAPYTAYMLGDVCNRVGLPKGVLNIINGRGSTVGNHIVSHKEIKAISFTGGTSTGKKIYENASSPLKKLSLEMGGKNPAIIFDDCDYELMINNLVRSCFLNQGQICLCSSRLLVQKTIYNRFKEDFCKKVSQLVIGNPLELDTEFGAISSKDQYKKIINYIALARKEGARVLIGGNKVKLNGLCTNGWFIEPTILEGLDQRSRLNQDEIFGPVVTLQSFNSIEQAIDIANDTIYGLSSTIWTKDIEKGMDISKQIDAGVIWINSWLIRDLRTPFGGMKHSGFGREGGNEILNFFTEQKNICFPA